MKISRTVTEMTTENFPSVNKTLLKFGYKTATRALHVYCSVKAVQRESTRSVTCLNPG